MRSRSMMLLLPMILWIVGGCSDGNPATPVDGADPDAVPQAEESQILVQLEDPDDDDGEHGNLIQNLRGERLERIGTSSFFILHLGPDVDPEEALEKAGDDFRILDASLNYRSSVPEGGPSEAPVLGSDLIGAISLQASLAPLRLPDAHGATLGAGVLVAVLDTGVDPFHPYLAGRLAPGGFDFIDQDDDPSESRDFVDNDRDGQVDEQYGHGTFVASLVLAVAPEASVLPVRVLNDDGYGNASTVASGIYWAVDAGARVINLSVQIAEDPRLVERAIDHAKENGVVVVASAGNSALEDVVFPARYSEVIAVAATDALGVAAPFTNFGSAIDLAAPGVEMIGAVPEVLNPMGTARWSGTSFASPLVSGSAALVLAIDPFRDAEQVRQTLESGAHPVDVLNPGLDGRLGAGLVDAAAAVGR